MEHVKKNVAAKRLRFLKYGGLPLGIILIIAGLVIVSNWGTSMVESHMDWYVTYSEELNGIGVCGLIIFAIGIVFLILWFIAVIALKSATPCPACGGLMMERSSVCPHCKSALSWGTLDNAHDCAGKQADSGVFYCQFCGTKADSGNQYCRACGRKLSK